MDVLRQNKSTIVTILEVLLQDPLYSWTLTDKKACKRQAVDNIGDDEGMITNGDGNYFLLFISI